MNFELTEDQLELQRTIREILTKESPPDLARAVTMGDSDGSGFWSTQVELDWPALALPEEHGGLGYGWVELAVLLEEMGYHASPGPYLASVTQFSPVIRELGDDEQRARFLSAVAGGALTGALAIDEGSGTWRCDAVRATAERHGEDLVISATKRHVVDGADADEIAVAVRLDGDLRVVVVPSESVDAEPVTPIDATTRHATVTLDDVTVSADRLLGNGDATDGLTRALEESTVAIAATTVGACQRIFELDLAYAKERRQFDVPIGSFQAVKHKLADMYRDIERARALTYFAAVVHAENDERRSLATSMAKASAGEAQRRCVQDGLQLFGGIGYTWENDLHLFLRRAKVGELHFGSSSAHRKNIARLTLGAA